MGGDGIGIVNALLIDIYLIVFVSSNEKGSKRTKTNDSKWNAFKLTKKSGRSQNKEYVGLAINWSIN